MFKGRLISIFLFVMTIILSSTYLYAEQIIILKDGTELEGEVIGSDDAWIKIKSESETHTFKRVDIKSIKKKMPREELFLPAEELYEKMRARLPKDDPKAHYKLGLLCLQRNLDKYAVLEFNKIVKLDAKYKPKIDAQIKEILEARAKGKYDAGIYYYNKGDYKKALGIFEKAVKVYPKNSLIEDFQEMVELCEEKLASIPELTKEKIEEMLKDGETPMPYTLERTKMIRLSLAELSKDKKDICCRRYMELAKGYLQKVESGESDEPLRDYYIGFYCYGIASYAAEFYDEAFVSLQKISIKIKEDFQNKLLIPLTLSELKMIEAFVEGLEEDDNKKITIRPWYYDHARDYEERAKEEKDLPAKKKLLKSALNCYLVLANSFPEGSEHKKAGIYGWARCFEELEELYR